MTTIRTTLRAQEHSCQHLQWICHIRALDCQSRAMMLLPYSCLLAHQNMSWYHNTSGFRAGKKQAVKCISRVWRRYKRKKLSASILHEMGPNDLACTVRRKIKLVEESSFEGTPPNEIRGPEYYKQQYQRRLLRSQRGVPVLDVDSDDEFPRSGTSLQNTKHRHRSLHRLCHGSLHQLLRVTAWQYAPVIQNTETLGRSLKQMTRLRKTTLLVASTTMRDAFVRLTRIM